MTVRVDYRCRRCGLVVELQVETPPTATRCGDCGGTAKRQWTSFGIGRTERSGSGVAAQPTAARPRDQRDGELCRTNPGIPGLCLLGESAGRSLVARATNDGRSLEREQHRQTAHLSETGRHGTVVSDHGHCHGGASPAAGTPETTSRGPREIF
ncbi:MAG: zinc ribbon domain-containing protein [Acidimicrobiia bacterium]|nr:zinc ribbon domain-containing protein [Acidimicrobiia bacterium]